MAPPVLSLRDVRLGFGGRPLFDGVDLSLNARDRVCLVGRNGGGKSTLLKVMAGLVQPDSGEIFRQPGTSVAYLEQEPDLSGWASLRDYVADGLPEADAHQAHRADSLLEGFGLDPYREPIGLSGGEARRVALARALVGRPDILMLDEPTNHLDLPTVQALEDRLEAFPGAVVLISHDRAFLTRLSRAVLWLDRGRVRRMDEGFAGFEAWRDGIFETEAVEQAKMDKLIAEETRWSRQGISARRKRNQGRLARLYALRKARADQIARPGQMTTEAVAGEKSGALVADLEDVAVSLGGREILSGITLRLMRGDRLGIVGPNGAGKTTLVRLLTGDLAASGGSIRLGTRLEPVIIDQSRSALRPDLSVWDTLCDAGGDHVMVRGQSR
ncbi:MAG: ABC-F family ATP-binding cassette domain-containing protein, partial [Rhodospirillaceae bacterium]